MAKFTVLFNGEHLKTYELDEPVIFIGRLPENTISLANMGISRRHAKIEEDAERKYMISDLNSLNGTFVNGKRIRKVMLKNGDKISIGKFTIIYGDFTEISQGISSGSISSTPHPDAQGGLTGQTQPRLTALPENKSSVHKGNQKSSGANTSGAVLIETNKHVVYKLDKPLVTIGSGEDDDIFVSGFMIGESQINIEKCDDGLRISAAKMMSKVKVNGRYIKSHLLSHKDRIEIGSSTFRFMENG
jgi:pSer/pThr/pTyr-binding forkhead associated (FHA) protein